MKQKEISEMTNEELATTLASLRNDVMKDKGNVAKGGQVINSGKMRQNRITVARILTIQQKRGMVG